MQRLNKAHSVASAGLRSLHYPGSRISHRSIHTDLLRKPQLPETHGRVDVAEFQELAYDPALPLVMRRTGDEVSAELPALFRWFTQPTPANREPTLTSKLREWADASFEYEMMCPSLSVLELSSHDDVPLKRFLLWLETHPAYNTIHGLLSSHIKHGYGTFSPQGSDVQLLRFSAPLAVLLAAIEHRDVVLAAQSGAPFTDLYIAQSSLEFLPAALKDDVPTPDLVKHAGKGDVYGTSIWLGLEPTYTPLHRDPNPNVFCQLCGSKAIRFIPPEKGSMIFRTAQKVAGVNTFSTLLSVEMMTGAQGATLHDAVWGKGASSDVQETILGPGDAMFIPKGWWHSVKSLGTQGGVNGSVNWWFR